MARVLRIRKVLAVPGASTADADTLYLLKEANGGVNPVLYTRSKTKYAKMIRGVQLTGSKVIYQSVAGQSVQSVYTIANYDSFTSYAVTVSAGSVAVNGATITVTSPMAPGVIYLSVNGEVSILTVLPPSVLPPTITYPTPSLKNVPVTFSAQVSAFAVSTGSDTVVSTEWQLATDAAFTTIVNTGSLVGEATQVPISLLNYASTYYLRIRKTGTTLGASAWSTPVKFSSVLIDLPTTESALLAPTTPVATENFGAAVAVSGDGTLMVAGASGGMLTGSSVGYVELYRYAGSSWQFKQRLYASDPVAGGLFGSAVAMNYDGSVIVVGSSAGIGGGAANRGAVYVYTYDAIQARWVLAQKLEGSVPTTGWQYGWSVAVTASGNKIVVGEKRAVSGAVQKGKLYIYQRNGTTWTAVSGLDLAGIDTSIQLVGAAVACDEAAKVVMVGAPSYPAGDPYGAVVPFASDGTTFTNPSSVIAPPPAKSNGMLFGSAVSVSQDGLWMAVGAPAFTNNGVVIGQVTLYSKITGSWVEQTVLYPDSLVLTQAFGTSVSLNADGTRLFVGEPKTGSAMGCVYIYDRKGVTWSLLEKVARASPATTDGFGNAVASDSLGKRVLIGSSTYSAVVANGGAVFDFKCRDTGILQKTRVSPNDPSTNDYFGYGVSLSSDGNTALVGAYLKDGPAGTGQGAAYVFIRSGSTWVQQAKLLASDPAANDAFGYASSLSADGDIALVSTTSKDSGAGTQQGAVYVFTRTGSTWTQQAKLLASDPAASDYFGYAVSLSSDGATALIGAYNKTESAGGSQGAAYVFTRSGSVWTQQTKLLIGDPATNDRFGSGVSLSSDGTTALIGAYTKLGAYNNQGATYVFTRSGSVWTQQAKLLASDPAANDYFGWKVGLASDGNTALIGATNKVGSFTAQGAAYVFTRSGSVWVQQAKLLAGDPATNDRFGYSVGLSSNGNTALIGGYSKTGTAGTNQGAAYVFTRSGSVWTQQAKLLASDPIASDRFGWSVGLSGDGSTYLVTAPNKLISASARGSAYFFK